MRVYWQQFSPGEKEAMLRHYILHEKNASVSPEKVCQAMQQTHFLACVSPGGGPSLVEFVSSKPGVPAGKAIAQDLTDGIYQAALRATGVDLEEEAPRSRRTRRAGKHK